MKKYNVYEELPLPVKSADAPRLGLSVQSASTFSLIRKIKKMGYVIPAPYTLADVEWVSTRVWYKPWTWLMGYPQVKLSARVEVAMKAKLTQEQRGGSI